MRKTLSTIGLATLLTIGIVSAGSILAPSGNQTSYFNYSYISTNNSTTTVKSASGVLHSITIGTPATSSVITLFDNASSSTGNIIAKVTLPATLLQQGPYTAVLDIYFANGLTIQQTGNTSTITASYY